MGVTSQAVSRWESGGSCPDRSLIPSIANYFAVSIDELFGYCDERSRRIDALEAQINDMKRRSDGTDDHLAACIAVARNALVEFPGNAKLMLCLASALYTAGYVRHGERHLIDAPSIEKALETIKPGTSRDQAGEELSQLYVNVGVYDKALVLAESAPQMWNSREFLQIYACDGKQQARAFGKTLLQAINSCAALIVHGTIANQHHMTPCEKAQSISGAMRHLLRWNVPRRATGRMSRYVKDKRRTTPRRCFSWSKLIYQTMKFPMRRIPFDQLPACRRTGPGGTCRKRSGSRQQCRQTPGGMNGSRKRTRSADSSEQIVKQPQVFP